jgi:light-regulated signal transduction histidine kinase (bacteriophytochrome)
MAAIQPCALLLLVGPDWQVETVSANVAMLGDFKPAAVVGQPLSELIGTKQIHNLRNRLGWLSSGESEVHDFGVEWGGVTLDLRATRDEDHYLIEAELAVEPRLPDSIGMVRSMTDRLGGKNPNQLAEQALRQLCALTGFDRHSIRDRKGEVIAAAGRDLPLSGVDSNGKTVATMIADRDAEPVPLLGNLASPLLGRAIYAAPDEAMREAMTANGTAASMTLPLRIDGAIVSWLHAQHSEPRRCGAERRSVAHLFAERLVARMARQGWTF